MGWLQSIWFSFPCSHARLLLEAVAAAPQSVPEGSGVGWDAVVLVIAIGGASTNVMVPCSYADIVPETGLK